MAIPKKMRLPAQKFHGRPRQTVSTPYFSLKVRESSVRENRLGIVAGVAVHKSAAKRNFLKRQAGEVLRAAAAKNFYGDIVLILFAKSNMLTKKQFRETLTDAVRALKPAAKI